MVDLLMLSEIALGSHFQRFCYYFPTTSKINMVKSTSFNIALKLDLLVMGHNRVSTIKIFMLDCWNSGLQL